MDTNASPSIESPATTEAGFDRLRERAALEAVPPPAPPDVVFEPFGDYVLARRIAGPEEKKVGSIYLPEQAHEKPMDAEVVKVGPGRETPEGVLMPMHVRVGDRVLIGKWSGTEVTIDDQPFLILKQDEILGRR